MVMSALDNTGKVLAAGAGTLTLAGLVTGTGEAVINGGTLDIEQAFAEHVYLASTGVLELGDSQGFGGVVSGLSKTGTNSLDLRDIGFVGAGEATYSRGVLTVTDGSHTAHIKLVGNYTGSTFTCASDGHGGVIVTDPTATSAPLAQAMASFQAAPASSASATAPYLTPPPPPRSRVNRSPANAGPPEVRNLLFSRAGEVARASLTRPADRPPRRAGPRPGRRPVARRLCAPG